MTVFEHADASNNLEQSLEICLEHVDANGGFQVAAWWSRDKINDLSLIGLNAQKDAQVYLGRIKCHVVYSHPMIMTLLDKTTTRGGELLELKFRAEDNL